MKTNTGRKKEWVRPQLIVLTRRTEEETVLNGCFGFKSCGNESAHGVPGKGNSGS